MTVLVTGGLGFLGRALTVRLLAAGNDVVVVDDASSAVVGAGHFASDRVRVVTADVATYAPPAPRYSMVFHLAGPVGPAGILRHAGFLAQMILRQTMAVVELCCRCDAPLVFVSSSEVYGRGGEHDEAAPCRVPVANTVRLEYGLGKRLAETVVENRMRTAGLPWAIVRPFNVAGPYQRASAGFVVPTFVGQALAGAPLTVFGDGAQRRAFGHVEDISGGIVAAGQRLGNRVYNLGCPENLTTMIGLARAVIARAGSRSEVVHVDPCSVHGPLYAEAFDKIPVVDRARRELGWSPACDLARIVADVVDHTRQSLAIT